MSLTQDDYKKTQFGMNKCYDTNSIHPLFAAPASGSFSSSQEQLVLYILNVSLNFRDKWVLDPVCANHDFFVWKLKLPSHVRIWISSLI